MRYLSKEDYDKLLESGMFWELYPELSGVYDRDIKYLGVLIG